MTCTRHSSGCLGYSYGIILFLFCLLNRWPSFVYAAEPSFASGGISSAASPVCAQGSGSKEDGNTQTHGSSNRRGGFLPAETSEAQLPEIEAPQEASGTAEAVQRGRSSFPESERSYGEEEAPAFGKQRFKSPPLCNGPIFPFLELSHHSLPNPKFDEVIDPRCQNWMTLEDVKGLTAVLRAARRLKSRVSVGVRPFTGSSILHRTLPIGHEFKIDFYDLPGIRPIQRSVFKRGYIIADGSWGVVTAVRRLPVTVTSFGVTGSGVPASSATDDGDGIIYGGSGGAAQTSAASAQPTIVQPSLSRIQRLMKAMRRVRLSVKERWGSGFSLSRRSSGNLGKHTAEDSLASESTQAQEVQSSSVLSSDSASPPQLRPSGFEAGASKAPAKKLLFTASSQAPMSSAAVGSSRSSHDDYVRSKLFIRELAEDLVMGRDPDSIYVLKVALVSDKHFPVDPMECAEASKHIIAERVGNTRHILSCMPNSFTADQLYNFGFVLPIAAGRLQNMDSYLGGSRFSPLHLLNYVQVLRPQLSDMYSIQVTGREGTRYMVKRLIQLAAHLSAAGIVHMDIKRENIGVSPKGELMLLDFDYVMVEGSEFFCNMKPTIEIAAPEIAQSTLYILRTGKKVKCIADKSLDAWDLGMTLFELVCGSQRYFACYDVQESIERRLDCIASLFPPIAHPRNQNLSYTRAPVHWGSCKPPYDLQEIIYSLLDLNPEKRLDSLKVFMYSDLFRARKAVEGEALRLDDLNGAG